MTFDRLVYIDRLKDAGVDETVARAHAEALRDALFETVATKTDLQEQTAALRSDLNERTSALRRDLNEQTSALRSEIRDETMSVRSEMNERFGSLDKRIELVARDLTIKGGLGLAGAVSLLGALKFFG